MTKHLLFLEWSGMILKVLEGLTTLGKAIKYSPVPRQKEVLSHWCYYELKKWVNWHWPERAELDAEYGQLLVVSEKATVEGLSSCNTPRGGAYSWRGPRESDPPQFMSKSSSSNIMLSFSFSFCDTALSFVHLEQYLQNCSDLSVGSQYQCRKCMNPAAEVIMSYRG